MIYIEILKFCPVNRAGHTLFSFALYLDLKLRAFVFALLIIRARAYIHIVNIYIIICTVHKHVIYTSTYLYINILQNRAARTGLLGSDSQSRSARTELPTQDGQNKTPGRDFQDRIARTGLDAI